MKKKRGLRRYYRNLENSFNPDSLDFEGEKNWFDLFHFHIDNTGLGNKSWKSRTQHLDALFIIAEKVEDKLKTIDKPFQFWIEIYENDSWDDSVYIHTENPNQTVFPTSLTFDSNVEVSNTELEKYLLKKEYIIKTKKLLEDDKPILCYFLQIKNFGIPLSLDDK
jgi:hypothetical protein